MDPQEEVREFLTLADIILKESTSIPKQSQKTSYYCRNFLMLSLFSAMLVPCLFDPVLSQIVTFLFPFRSASSSSNMINSSPSQWTKVIFFCLIVVFTFPLLSAAASFYPSKPTASAISVIIPSSVFKRLFVTYLWVYLIMFLYNVVFLGFLFLLWVALDTHNKALLVFASVMIFCLFLADDMSLCHLASMVSLFEPVHSFTAMDKCYELMMGRNRMATTALHVFLYLLSFGFFNGVFGYFLVQGRFEYRVFLVVMVIEVVQFVGFLHR